MKLAGRRVIAIEGIDGVGKESVANATVAVLNENGYAAEKLSFPRYDTPAGNLCERYLNKEFGDPVKMNPFIASAPYTLDRIQYFTQTDTRSAPWEFLVLDRCYYTNFIHQGSKITNPYELAVWMASQYASEIVSTGLYAKFFEIYFLQLSEEARKNQISNRSELDGLESNDAYQQKCVDFIKYTQTELFKNTLKLVLRDLGYDKYYFDDISSYYIDRVKFITVTHVNDSSKIAEANRTDAEVIANLAVRMPWYGPITSEYWHFNSENKNGICIEKG